MTSEYADDIAALCAYPPANLKNCWGNTSASMGKTQPAYRGNRKICTRHVLQRGGREALYNGEQRVLVGFTQRHCLLTWLEMSAFEVTDKPVRSDWQRPV